LHKTDKQSLILVITSVLKLLRVVQNGVKSLFRDSLVKDWHSTTAGQKAINNAQNSVTREYLKA